MNVDWNKNFFYFSLNSQNRIRARDINRRNIYRSISFMITVSFKLDMHVIGGRNNAITIIEAASQYHTNHYNTNVFHIERKYNR